MNETEAMQYIAEKNRLGSVLGLENIKELLRRLGNPQDYCRVVHIAGTNGKGSILAYMDAVLRDAGYQVGRYISPTVFSYLERFQINGEYMDRSIFATLLTRVAVVLEDMEQDGYTGTTAFEIETALAFLYFFEMKTDLVLLETGIGGRLDATNVVKAPVCTILASIRMDHMKILGDTISQIAYEKTGILRDDVPCVVYPLNAEAMSVIRQECSLHNIDPIVPDLAELTIEKEDLYYEQFSYKNVNYKTSLLGKYQIYNAITAIEVLNITKNKLNIDLKKENIQKGLHNAKWKGRFEILERNPYVIRDGAHNYDAAEQLYEQLTKHFTNRRITFIIGVLEDKEHYALLSRLVPLASRVYVLTVPDNPRALPADRLAEEASMFCQEVHIADSPEEAYRLARAEAQEDDVIVAFGSLYYIGRIGDRNGTTEQTSKA